MPLVMEGNRLTIVRVMRVDADRGQVVRRVDGAGHDERIVDDRRPVLSVLDAPAEPAVVHAVVDQLRHHVGIPGIEELRRERRRVAGGEPRAGAVPDRPLRLRGEIRQDDRVRIGAAELRIRVRHVRGVIVGVEVRSVPAVGEADVRRQGGVGPRGAVEREVPMRRLDPLAGAGEVEPVAEHLQTRWHRLDLGRVVPLRGPVVEEHRFRLHGLAVEDHLGLPVRRLVGVGQGARRVSGTQRLIGREGVGGRVPVEVMALRVLRLAREEDRIVGRRLDVAAPHAPPGDVIAVARARRDRGDRDGDHGNRQDGRPSAKVQVERATRTSQRSRRGHTLESRTVPGSPLSGMSGNGSRSTRPGRRD